MDVYIVDTNIVFSAAMNPYSEIGQFLILSKLKGISFYAPEYLKLEIDRHLPKLFKASRLTEVEVRRVIELAYEKIQFVKDADIPLPFWVRGADLARDVDEDDIVFLALTEMMQETLWTGDSKLYRHLISKGYQRVVIFDGLKSKHP